MAWQSLVAGVITGLMSVTGLISVAGILMDGPRFRAWERGWLLMARGILTGLWRSVRPFASSVPSFGRQRRSQRLVLLREQRDFSEVMLDAHRLLAETQHRVSLSGEVCSRCGDRPPSSRERSTCYDCQVEVMKGGCSRDSAFRSPSSERCVTWATLPWSTWNSLEGRTT